MSNYNNREGGRPAGGRFGGGKPSFGGKRFGGKPSFGGKSWGGDRGGSDRPAAMHQATCSVCGKPCEVPFKPMHGKPIYCKEHFISKDGGQRGDRRDDRGGDRFPKRDFVTSSHASAGASAPAFNASKGLDKSPAHDQMTKQLESVNAKLERLIAAVDALASAMKPAKEVVVAEEAPAPKKAAKVVKKKASKK